MNNMNSMDSDNSTQTSRAGGADSGGDSGMGSGPLAQGDRLTGGRGRRRMWKVLSAVGAGALLVSGLSVVAVAANNTLVAAPAAHAASNGITTPTPNQLSQYKYDWNTSTNGSWTGSSTFNPNWLYEGWDGNPDLGAFTTGATSSDGSITSGTLQPLITGVSAGTSGLTVAQLDTLALDAGGEGRPQQFYAWGWASGPTVLPAAIGQTSVPSAANYTTVVSFLTNQTGTVVPNNVYYVPRPDNTGQGTQFINGWSGGEVDQNTGRLYFSGQEGSYLASNGAAFEMMIFDPTDGSYNASGIIKPAVANRTATGLVASDMVIDAAGNAYILVAGGPVATPPGGGTAVSTEYLVKITPGAPGDWTYSLVTPLWFYNGTSYAAMNGDAYAMGFLNGYLYANQTGAAGGLGYVTQINPRTGVAQFVGGSAANASINGTAAAIQDFASPQSAAILNGTVYNDANGNGQVDANDVGVPGQTVQLYDPNGNVIGQQTTNALGQYSFLMPNTASESTYYARVVQPQVGGANAVQTFATVTAQNNQNTGDPMSFGKTLASGAPQTPYVDPPAPAAPSGASATGGQATMADLPAYSAVDVKTANDVTTADFGISSQGSYGDAASDSTIAQNGPQHVEGPTGPNVYLGATDGSYSDGSNTAGDHAASDDGVTLQTANWAAPAEGQILAAGNNYTFNYVLSGSNQAKANVYAWLGATIAGSLQWAPGVTGSANKLAVSVPSGTQTGGAITPAYLRVDASSNPAITASTPDNSGGAYAPAVGSTASQTQTWTSDGETEDYQIGVANAVVHLAVGTDGTGSYGYSLTNVSTTAPQSASDTITVGKAGTVSSSVSHAVQTVGSDVVVTPSSVPSGENLGVAALYNTVTGDQITTLTPGTGGTITIPGADVAQGADVTLLLTYAQEPSATTSTWSLSPASIPADGTTASTVTVNVNSAGNSPLSGQTVTITAPADVKVSTVKDNDDGTYTATLTSTVAGTYPIGANVEIAGTATPITNPSATQTLTVTASNASATTSSYSVSSTPVVADGKTGVPVTVTTKDDQGNLTSGSVSLTVDAPAEFTNGTQTTTVTTDSTGAATVNVTSTKVGAYTVKATVSGQTVAASPADADIANFMAGPAAQNGSGTTWTVTPSTSVPADGTSAFTGTVTVGDAQGNPITTGVTVTIDVPTGVSASSGGTPLTVTNEQAEVTTDATGTATVKYTSTTAGTYSVGAYLNGTSAIGTKASLVFSSTAANAANSTWSVTPTTTQTADGTAAFTATVNLNDSTGAPVTGDASGISITSAATTGLTFGTPADNGDGSYTIKITSKTAGTFVLTASVGGAQIGTTNSVTFAAGPGDATGPATSWNVTPTSSVPADGTSEFTGTVKVGDANGNPVNASNVLVDLPTGATATSGGTVLTPTDGQVTIVTDPTGTATVTFTSTTAGTYQVGAYINTPSVEIGTKASLVFTSTSANAANSTWSVTPTTSQPADGTSAFTATVNLNDSAGTPVTGEGASISISSAPATGVVFSTPTDNGDGSYTIKITSTTPNTDVLTASVGGAQIGTTNSVTFVAGPPDPTGPNTLWRVTPTTSLPADGTSSFIGTVTVGDANGNTISNATVTIDVPTGLTATAEGTPLSVTNQQATVTTNNLGQARISFTSTTANTYQVGAYLGTDAIGSKLDLQFTSTSASAANSTWSVTPTTSQPADGTSAFTATVNLKDSTGNPVIGDASGIAIASSPTGPTISTATDNGDGSYTVKITSTTAGPFALTASVANAQIGAANNVTFTAGPVSSTLSTLKIDSATAIPADGTTSHTITATVLDSNSNPVNGQAVTFATTGGTLSASSVTTGADGKAVVTITSTKTGAFKVSATAGTAALSGSPVTANFTWGPPSVGPTGTSTLTVSTGSVPADGTTTQSATATITDATGNQVGGQTVTFTVSAGAEFVNGNQTITGQTDPTTGAPVVVTITSTTAGPYQVTATLGGTALKGSPATVTFGAGQAVSANSTFAVTPAGPILANGTAAYTATVTANDSNGNPVPGQTISFALPSGLTGPATATTGTDGVATATYTATAAGTYPIDAYLDPAQTDQIGTEQDLVYLSAAPPPAPALNPSNGTFASGSAIPGDTIKVTDAAGTVIGTGTVGTDGTFNVKPLSPTQGNGTTVTAVDVSPGGVDSQPSSVVVDAIAPGTPTVDPTNGSKVTGTADAGTTVTVSVPGANGSTVVLCTATASASGVYSCTPKPTPANGSVLTVTSTDPAQNDSPSITVTVDSVPPTSPILDPSNGKDISGTGDPGTSVTVTDPNTGGVLCTTTISASGTFSCAPDPTPSNGESLSVTSTDPSGNVSDSTTITINTTPPPSPIVDPSNGTTITGTAEPGDSVTVSVTDPSTGNTTVLCTTTADAKTGAYSCEPSPAPTNGQDVNVTVTDPAGNTSFPGNVTVDTVAPNIPVVNPSNGSKISGTAEVNSKITVTDSAGNVLCTTTATAITGTYSCVPDPVPSNGASISVNATDASGNISKPGTVTISTTAPAAPIVNPSNGSEISGTATPGTTVTVQAGDSVLCTLTVPASGAFSCVPSPTPGNGQLLDVIASDAAGNNSAPTPVTIDSIAPAPPVITSPTSTTDTNDNKPVVSGTGEKGATVTVTDSKGNTVCTTTVGTDGNWSCTGTTAMPDGSASLSATQTDAAGNVSDSSSSVSFQVDTTAPAAPVLKAPAAGSTSTNAVPTMSGTGEPGATVKITDELGRTVCTTTVDANGNWACGATSATGTGAAGSTISLKDNNGNVYCSVTVAANGTWTCPPVTFTNAQHTLTATQTDAAGNVSVAASTSFTVKAAPTITSPTAGSTTTNQTPTVSGTASAGDTVVVTAGSSTTALCTVTVGADGSWSCVLPTQAAGSTTLTVTDTTLGTSTTVTYTTIAVDRIQGADRYSTAAAAAAAEFPNGAKNVIVAVGTNYPDALSAVPAAAKLGAPILLTTVGAVPAATMNELNALRPSQVIVLGTTASVSAAAFNQIQGGVTSKPKMVRIGGIDRYDTSRQLAQYVWGSIGVGTVFVATGQSFADAEAAAPAAAKSGSPLVLVNGDASSVDSATTKLLKSFGVSRIHVVGATAELNSSVLAGLDSIADADRTSGPNIDATAVAVSQAFFPSSDQVFIARDDDFADALTGGAAAAHVGAPMLLTTTQTLANGVTSEVQRLKATQVHVMGDPNSITNSTLSTLVNGLNSVQ